MRKALKLKPLVAACTCVVGLMASGTHAAPITQWTYNTNAIFTDPRWSDGSTGGRSATDSALIWGGSTSYQDAVQSGTLGQFFAQNQSALTIGDFSQDPETLEGGGPASGTVNTIMEGDSLGSPDVIGRGVSFTHWNNPISPDWSSLEGATIVDTIELRPFPEDTSLGFEDGPTFSFVYNFKETPNSGDANGVCEDGLTAVSYGWNAATQTGGCPDIFAFETFGTTNQLFTYNGFDYLLSILQLNEDGTLDTLGIPELNDDQCNAVNFDGSCSGFTTLEGQRTTVRFGFAISEIPLQDVPAPGVLALLGIGAAGLAGSTRRRR